MDDETKQKIADTVASILKEADMEVMTEYKVRKQASDILSIDLSQPEPKAFVRHLVESFLNAEAAEIETGRKEPEEEEKEAAGEDTEQKPVVESEEEEEEADDNQKNKKGRSLEYDDDGDLIVCRLSDKRRVTIQDFRGKTLVSIREYYTKDGKELPSSKGISLTTEQWSVFKQNAPAIEQAIRRMETR